MSSIREFLRLDREEVTATHEVNLGRRLADYSFVIRPMTYDEWSRYQREATSAGKNGKSQFDQGAFMEKAITTCCIDPDFTLKGFIEENGCQTPNELLCSLLKPGEIVELGNAIIRLSGFDLSSAELVAEAKN